LTQTVDAVTKYCRSLRAQKEFDKAIKAYEKLAEVDKNNPEVFYGLGNVLAMDLKEYEKD
jgi:tetratricopeptide (TPR) repeat protein